MSNTLKFIDLFAGIGGFRMGFEHACNIFNIQSKCIFTSEIKPHAVSILEQNNPSEQITGDITKVKTSDINDFDVLLAGFPCQAFSVAGKRLGFQDTRGTLFFDVARILKDKRPKGFILENVEGLVGHDHGKTFDVILSTLKKLDYKVAWKVLNSKYFGVPQDRRRIYIVGSLKSMPDLNNFSIRQSELHSILQTGLPCKHSAFINRLLSRFPLEDLYGKSIKDKRGGNSNIHSWDLELKGNVSIEQKLLLNSLLKERRKKKWAEEYGIQWMDGMPLTISQIKTFYNVKNLKGLLDDLVEKRYLSYEHPKKLVGNRRVLDENLPMGYNIVTGKMSFEVNKVLSPYDIAPTLVAMDMKGLFVPDIAGIRNLSLREGLRLFGFPESFKFDIDIPSGYDLLGNTVVVPVVSSVAQRLIKSFD